MWQHRSSRDYELDDLMMLKVGRHIRPNENFKMIIGREQGENKFMEGYRKMYPYIHCTSHNGPLTLIDGTITEADAELAARIAARFGQGRDAEEVEMSINYLDGKNTIIKVKPMPKDEILEEWYV